MRNRIIVYVLTGVGACLLQLYGQLTRQQQEQILAAADNVPRIQQHHHHDVVVSRRSSQSSSTTTAFESLTTTTTSPLSRNNHNRTTTPSHDDEDDVVHLLPGHFFPSCHATANARHIKSIQQERTQKDQPHFSSIVKSPSRFEESKNANSTTLYWTAIFNLVPSIWKPGRERIRDERWINATWECDSQPAVVVAGGCPAGTGFAIQCPQQEERISKLTVYPVNYSLATKMTYRVKDHVDCEVDHPLRVSQENATILGTAYLFGDLASSPHHLLEWIEYHRFIGVHHFYIYLVKEFVEDEWNVLPNLPYITYIPWDMLQVFTIRARAEVLSFQIAQQTDVLYRSRGSNIQWVTYNDIDEYIQIVNKKKNNNNKDRRLLLDDTLERFVRRNPDLGALMGLTVNFGYQYANESAHPPDYTMEYAYRAIQPIRGARQKCLVRPGYTDYYNNHRVSLGNETVHLKPFYHLRYNHYKKPNSGVFLKFQPEKVVVADSTLRDAFLERLKVRVDAVKKSMIYANGGKIRSEWTHFDHLI